MRLERLLEANSEDFQQQIEELEKKIASYEDGNLNDPMLNNSLQINELNLQIKTLIEENTSIKQQLVQVEQDKTTLNKAYSEDIDLKAKDEIIQRLTDELHAAHKEITYVNNLHYNRKRR